MDGSFELVDLTSGRNKRWVEKVFGDITKRSAAQQVAIGGVSGMVTGFITIKVTKAVLVTVGMSLILLQVAHHQGYIKINYRAIESEINRTKDKVDREIQRNLPGASSSLKRFFQKNICLAGGFAGGFLIGMAF